MHSKSIIHSKQSTILNFLSNCFLYKFLFILLIICCIVYYYLIKIIVIKYDQFVVTGSTTNNSNGNGNGIISNSIDRTRLYGSLFLDGLDKVIKNMTDPPINYDNKRIEIIRYNDVLL